MWHQPFVKIHAMTDDAGLWRCWRYVTSADELTQAVNEAMDSGKPTWSTPIIDENAGTESGRIGNLNPQSVVTKNNQSSAI